MIEITYRYSILDFMKNLREHFWNENNSVQHLYFILPDQDIILLMRTKC